MERISHTKILSTSFNNPASISSGLCVQCFDVNGKCVYEALQDTRLQRPKLIKVNRRKN
jgi:hypothetical protein